MMTARWFPGIIWHSATSTIEYIGAQNLTLEEDQPGSGSNEWGCAEAMQPCLKVVPGWIRPNPIIPFRPGKCRGGSRSRPKLCRIGLLQGYMVSRPELREEKQRRSDSCIQNLTGAS